MRCKDAAVQRRGPPCPMQFTLTGDVATEDACFFHDDAPTRSSGLYNDILHAHMPFTARSRLSSTSDAATG